RIPRPIPREVWVHRNGRVAAPRRPPSPSQPRKRRREEYPDDEDAMVMRARNELDETSDEEMYEDAYSSFNVPGIVPLSSIGNRGQSMRAIEYHPSSHGPQSIRRAIEYFPQDLEEGLTVPLPPSRSPSPEPGPSRPRAPSPPYVKKPINKRASRVRKQ